mmetsp:Transcript_8846/g.19193  ORF Transcript_8846/g.19193 Transcript_8846/m.19193 type:complete len:203 (+) Transcript_8846:70-678(+)
MATGATGGVEGDGDIQLLEKLMEKPVVVKFEQDELVVSLGTIYHFKVLARLLEVGDGQPIPLAGECKTDFLSVVSLLERKERSQATPVRVYMLHHWYNKYDVPALKLEIQDLIERIAWKAFPHLTIKLLLVAAQMEMKQIVCQRMIPQLLDTHDIDEKDWKEIYDYPWVVQAAFERLLRQRQMDEPEKKRLKRVAPGLLIDE